MKITWLGHSCFLIQEKDIKIIIDPFIKDNPSFPANLMKDISAPNYILITHGHSDHVGDVIELFDKNKTKIISNFEVCAWLETEGISNYIDMNIGGTISDNGLIVTMVNALHTSSILDNGNLICGGLATGFIISLFDNKTIYHLGDTDIFSDMQLIQKIYRPKIGLVPMGGRFTMSSKIAALACNEFLEFDTIIPMHYNTFPILENNANNFKEMVSRGNVVILNPGDFFEC